MVPITSFDQVPAALNYLINEVDSLKRALNERSAEKESSDQWFDLNEFCQYHPAKPAPTTVYGWVARRLVPHKRDGKHLIFLKSEIDAWLKSKSRKTAVEIETAAQFHIDQQRRGGRKAA